MVPHWVAPGVPPASTAPPPSAGDPASAEPAAPPVPLPPVPAAPPVPLPPVPLPAVPPVAAPPPVPPVGLPPPAPPVPLLLLPELLLQPTVAERSAQRSQGRVVMGFALLLRAVPVDVGAHDGAGEVLGGIHHAVGGPDDLGAGEGADAELDVGAADGAEHGDGLGRGDLEEAVGGEVHVAVLVEGDAVAVLGHRLGRGQVDEGVARDLHEVGVEGEARDGDAVGEV